MPLVLQSHRLVEHRAPDVVADMGELAGLDDLHPVTLRRRRVRPRVFSTTCHGCGGPAPGLYGIWDGYDGTARA
ncbi:hypothetical protein GCM10010442_22510 [Kitasatospora kifunensis]